jgi:hypothetical protein
MPEPPISAAGANLQAGEKVYTVAYQNAEEEHRSDVAARNAGEAAWLVHARNKDPAGTQYTVAPVDGSEPARNFTVGNPRRVL